jgi:hypothetical protein
MTSLSPAIICDLDGTLCDHSHRLHFIDQNHPKNISIADKQQLVVENGKITDTKFPNLTFKINYDSFYETMGEDGVNDWCYEILQRTHHESYGDERFEIIFVTGRPERFRKKTMNWLANNALMSPHSIRLFMRPDFIDELPENLIYIQLTPDENGVVRRYIPEEINDIGPRKLKPDHRPAHEVKKEIYHREIKGKYDVLFCLDDDPKCVQMYRDLGLRCLDVGRKYFK